MNRFASTHRQIDMLLPDVLKDPERQDYRDFYNSHHASLRMLDNGAWESAALRPPELLEIAIEYGVDEIIMPDILNEPESTFELTQDFLETADHWIEDRILYGLEHLRYAAVVHGSTQHEAQTFVESIADLQHDRIRTIAIGRAFARQVGNPTARYELALWIRRRFHHRFQVHLLGFNDEWPTELNHCRSWPGIVRSVDTVAPFTYALNRLPIEIAGKVSVPRPKDYFARSRVSSLRAELIKHNIQTLDQWGCIRQWG